MWAYDAWQKDRTVFSTIQLGYPHEPLDFNELKLSEGEPRFWNGWVAIDELNFYFDGRRSLTGKNIQFAAFLLQQKKQGCTITGTTHDLDSLDVRLRRNYDFLINPSVYPKYPRPPEVITFEIENGPLQAPFRKTVRYDCRPFLGMYDSYAIYDPFKGKSVSPDRPKRSRKPRVEL